MRNRFALASLCISLGLAAAGCGGEPEQEPSGAQGSSEPPGTGVKVSMKDLRFDPMEVTVKRGGTITWTNDDSVAHTVTKESGPGLHFDSGNVEGGGIFEQKFTEAGKISYLCQIHRGQTGTITVE